TAALVPQMLETLLTPGAAAGPRIARRGGNWTSPPPPATASTKPATNATTTSASATGTSTPIDPPSNSGRGFSPAARAGHTPPSVPKAAIEIHGLVKRFGEVVAVDGLD